jgi:hypothetical protein
MPKRVSISANGNILWIFCNELACSRVSLDPCHSPTVQKYQLMLVIHSAQKMLHSIVVSLVPCSILP